MITLRGKCSWFGGPEDTGVAPDEGLAFIYELDDAPRLFLPYQPENTTGLARRLDPQRRYVACRWDYESTPKEELLSMFVRVRNPRTGKWSIAKPADWGPHQDTGRVADLSPGLLEYLGLTTDDEVEVDIPVRSPTDIFPTPYAVTISSGHGLKVRGASGIIDEVDEARRVVERVVGILKTRGTTVHEFHDDTSTTQEENLETIVDFHNSTQRNLDVSVHFNAYTPTDKPMGTEVLFVSQEDLAAELSADIALSGHLIDRGPKERTNLYFLNNTTAPAVLIEVCFVDSAADVEAYNEGFDRICHAISQGIDDNASV